VIRSWGTGNFLRAMVGSAPEAKRAQLEQYKGELSRDGSIGGASAATTDSSGAASTSSDAGDASLDTAKSHASDGMSGIAGDAEKEGATRKSNDATTGGGGGSGAGGGGGNTVADMIDVQVAYTMLSMRSGSAGEGSGASSPTELDDLMSTWSTIAPAVFPSLVSPAPEGDATAELLEFIGQSGDSDYLLDAIYLGSPPPPRPSAEPWRRGKKTPTASRRRCSSYVRGRPSNVKQPVLRLPAPPQPPPPPAPSLWLFPTGTAHFWTGNPFF
ncbi:unnamed protein product, partial [Ectocarpus sp. 13 AM-2016]